MFQLNKNYRRFGDHLCPNRKGLMWRKIQTLLMRTEIVPETLAIFNVLTLLFVDWLCSSTSFRYQHTVCSLSVQLCVNFKINFISRPICCISKFQCPPPPPSSSSRCQVQGAGPSGTRLHSNNNNGQGSFFNCEEVDWQKHEKPLIAQVNALWCSGRDPFLKVSNSETSLKLIITCSCIISFTGQDKQYESSAILI